MRKHPLLHSGKNPRDFPLDTPSGKIEIFSQTIADFGYHDCPGHPVWHPPEEWLGAALSAQFPLHLVSPQPGDKLHSQMECALADIPGERPMPVTMNPADAAQRGVNHGDLVLVFNQRGKCRARAQVTDDIRQGVVSLSTGAWYNPDEKGQDVQGNPNVLTRDLGTSRIGQGSSAHTTLVEIRRWETSRQSPAQPTGR